MTPWGDSYVEILQRLHEEHNRTGSFDATGHVASSLSTGECTLCAHSRSFPVSAGYLCSVSRPNDSATLGPYRALLPNATV